PTARRSATDWPRYARDCCPAHALGSPSVCGRSNQPSARGGTAAGGTAAWQGRSDHNADGQRHARVSLGIFAHFTMNPPTTPPEAAALTAVRLGLLRLSPEDAPFPGRK